MRVRDANAAGFQTTRLQFRLAVIPAAAYFGTTGTGTAYRQGRRVAPHTDKAGLSYRTASPLRRIVDGASCGTRYRLWRNDGLHGAGSGKGRRRLAQRIPVVLSRLFYDRGYCPLSRGIARRKDAKLPSFPVRDS